MRLKQVKDRIMITMVVSIPVTVAMPMIVMVATSSERPNIVQELQLGLQRAGEVAESAKKSSGQIGRLV